MKGLVWMLLMLLGSAQFLAAAGTSNPDPDPNPAVKPTIKGKVVDLDSQTPMEYANISIYKSTDSTLVSGGITNEKGEFSIDKLTVGNYYVEANFIGFNKTRIKNIAITADKKLIDLGTIKLEAAHQELGDVQVVAERQRMEYKVDKKVINVAQDINAAGGTAVDVLENTPSVQVDIEGNVSLRGSSSFTVFIDGRPSALTGSDALQQIPASALESIEIITNPSAKYDPDGQAGIINLVTKKNALAGFDGIVNASGATDESRSIDFTLSHKNAKRNITFGFDTNRRISNADIDSERETWSTSSNDTLYKSADGDRKFDRHGFTVKGGLDLYLSDNTTLGFTASAGQFNFDSRATTRDYYLTLPAETEKYTLALENANRNNNFIDGNVNFTHKFNKEGTHKLEGMVYFRTRTGDDCSFQSEVISDANWNPGNIYDLQIRTTDSEDSKDYRAQLDYTRPLGAAGKLEAGLQSRIERDNEDYIFENFDTDAQEWINDPDFSSSMTFSRDIHSAYTTLSTKINKIELMGGLRGEYTKRITKHTAVADEYKIDRFDWFPSLHASYNFSEATQLMASYSRRINRPRGRDLDPFPTYMDQTTIRVGNPALKPEYTGSYDLSFLQRFGQSFASIDGFYRKTSNVISRVSEVDDDGIMTMTSVNTNNSKSLGGELMLNLNLTKWFLLNSSISVYQYTLNGEYDGEYINRSSTNLDGRASAAFKFSTSSRLQLTGNYRGPSVSTQGDQDSFFYSDLSFRQEFMKRKLTATASMKDIFGTAGFGGTSSGTNFNSKFKFQHQPRIIELTLSFKLNNYKADNKRDGGTNEMDYGGGGEY